MKNISEKAEAPTLKIKPPKKQNDKDEFGQKNIQ